MPGVEIELPGHRLCEIAVRLLSQKEVAELARVAQIGKLVLIAPLAFHLTG